MEALWTASMVEIKIALLVFLLLGNINWPIAVFQTLFAKRQIGMKEQISKLPITFYLFFQEGNPIWLSILI